MVALSRAQQRQRQLQARQACSVISWLVNSPGKRTERPCTMHRDVPNSCQNIAVPCLGRTKLFCCVSADSGFNMTTKSVLLASGLAAVCEWTCISGGFPSQNAPQSLSFSLKRLVYGFLVVLGLCNCWILARSSQSKATLSRERRVRSA